MDRLIVGVGMLACVSNILIDRGVPGLIVALTGVLVILSSNTWRQLWLHIDVLHARGLLLGSDQVL